MSLISSQRNWAAVQPHFTHTNEQGIIKKKQTSNKIWFHLKNANGLILVWFLCTEIVFIKSLMKYDNSDTFNNGNTSTTTTRKKNVAKPRNLHLHWATEHTAHTDFSMRMCVSFDVSTRHHSIYFQIYIFFKIFFWSHRAFIFVQHQLRLVITNTLYLPFIK